MKTPKLLLPLALLFLTLSCQQSREVHHDAGQAVLGKLFIIGGGKRPVEMIDRMITESGLDDSGYVLILPWASGEPDSAIYYSSKQFSDRGLDSIRFIHPAALKGDLASLINLIENASLIYISGGDQSRFMKLIHETPIGEGLFEAYVNGATIAGTSAGAALMSAKMITGNEFKHPVYTGRFRSIEANNIELASGLGLLDGAIIDQHFIKRERWNRLIAVCLENPENICIGIDESTALIVYEGVAEVVGESQVITLKHSCAETKIVNGLLGGMDLDLSIYLPGDSLKL